MLRHPGIHLGHTAMKRIRTRDRRPVRDVRLETLERRTLLDGNPIDLSFGADGRAKVDVAGLAEEATLMHVLPDGKILIAGEATFAFTKNIESAATDDRP